MSLKCFFGLHSYKAIFAVDAGEIVAVMKAKEGSIIPCFRVMACRQCGKAYVDGRIDSWVAV